MHGSVAPTFATTKQVASTDPCTWLSTEDVSRVLGVQAVVDSNSGPPVPICTFAFRSSSGIATDLVVSPSNLNPKAMPSTAFPGHTRQRVDGLGDDAVFFRAHSIADGNSTLFVTHGKRGFFIASEFVTQQQAERLARVVLQHW